MISSPRQVWLNSRCKRNEDKLFQRDRKCVFNQSYNKNCPKTIWVHKGIEFAVEYKNVCNAQGLHI